MSGYKECAACGRRFFSNDDSDFCSRRCFSAKSVSTQRKPVSAVSVVSIVSILLFLFFIFESLSVNFFFITDFPLLKGYATSVFADSGYEGVFFLHEQLQNSDNDDLSLQILETMAFCPFIEKYQWKTRLLEEVSAYGEEPSPELRRAVLKIYGQAGELPEGVNLVSDLMDIETRDTALETILSLRDIRFIPQLKQWLSYSDSVYYPEGASYNLPFVPPSEDDWLSAVDIGSSVEDSNMQNARFLVWIAECSDFPAARIKALKNFRPLLLHFRKRAIGTSSLSPDSPSVQAVLAVQRIAASSGDAQLKELAKTILAAKEETAKTAIEFNALDIFDGEDE